MILMLKYSNIEHQFMYNWLLLHLSIADMFFVRANSAAFPSEIWSSCSAMPPSFWILVIDVHLLLIFTLNLINVTGWDYIPTWTSTEPDFNAIVLAVFIKKTWFLWVWMWTLPTNPPKFFNPDIINARTPFKLLRHSVALLRITRYGQRSSKKMYLWIDI